jgi:serine/threonine-protein kinase
MPSPDTDRNLLFGVLAFQADLLDAHRFAEGCAAWAAKKDKPLADLLVERQWLSAPERAAVDLLLERKLQKHAGDVHASLAAVASPEARRALDTVSDPDVEQSLASLPMDGNASDLPTVDALPAAGRYRVLRPHAKGGLGEVFVAEDIELHRPVALKQMQRRHADNAPSRSRFVLEAEVTGGLEHPGIVPVYGLGLYPDGRPFYAMRLIKGESLREAVARFHRAPDFSGAAFRQLLRRFVDVCNAVAYAHSRGVLHRDLKPANVMLGPFGETLVVDWGLAKVVGRDRTQGNSNGANGEATLQPASASSQAETVVGTALGTPAYMSPEQAAGRVGELGPASDVYSLGATLYAVLTGRAPFEGPDQGEILRQVQRGDFAAPRHVQPAVPAALDTVCRKAMALNPGARYPTPLALAADVERWLADEPVSAHRDPVTVRLLRWGRRHQRLVAGGTALLLTAVLALALGLAAVEHERKQTAAASARERQAREQAEAHFQLAKDAVERYLNAVTEDPRLKEQDFFELRKKLLETAVPFYERFAQLKAGDPQQQAARGRAYHRLAHVRAQTGDQEVALADYGQMRAVFARLAADFPTVPEYRHELARSHLNLGSVLDDLGKRAEAEAEYRRALALLEQLAADFPTVAAYLGDLAHSHNNLGSLLDDLGKRAEAEAEYHRALALQAHLATECPTVPQFRRDLAKSHNNLGALLLDLGKHAEAEAEYRRALALYGQLVADFPTVPQYRRYLASSHSNLGILLAAVGKRPEAEAEYRQAIGFQEKLATAFPAVPEYRQDLARSHSNLGALLQDLGKRAEAEAEFRRALALQEKLATDSPAVPECRQELATSRYNLGVVLSNLGKRAEAEAEYRRAITLQEQLAAAFPAVPDYRGELLRSHNNLSILLESLAKWREAQTEYGRVIALREKLVADCPTVSDHAVQLGGSYCNMGNLLLGRGEAAASLAWYAKAQAVLRPALDKQARLVTARLFLRNVHLGQARALNQLGRHTEAAAAWEQTLALNDEKPRDGWLRLQRASALARAGQHSEATAAVAELLELGNADRGTLYGAACVYARAAAQAAKEASKNTNSLLAEQYARRAMTLLRQAVQKGYQDVAQMKKDKDLDGLRARDDFRELLAQLEQNVGPSK